MRDLLSFADVAVVGGCAARSWCVAEVEAKSTRACQTIEKHSLAANEVPQRPWAADRYLPSDLADGDFQSTASLSCTTGSLARKEGRSLFYGAGKQRILPRRGSFLGLSNDRDYDLDGDRAERELASESVELATPRAVSPCPGGYCWLVCVLLSELALSHSARAVQSSE